MGADNNEKMKCRAKRKGIQETGKHRGRARIWVTSGRKCFLMVSIRPEILEYKRH